jgi:hypothetical protein
LVGEASSPSPELTCPSNRARNSGRNQMLITVASSILTHAGIVAGRGPNPPIWYGMSGSLSLLNFYVNGGSSLQIRCHMCPWVHGQASPQSRPPCLSHSLSEPHDTKSDCSYSIKLTSLEDATAFPSRGVALSRKVNLQGPYHGRYLISV